MKFKDLKIGELFTVWGDVDLNYDYAKVCLCKKVNDNTGKEIDGIRFSMGENDNVEEVKK